MSISSIKHRDKILGIHREPHQYLLGFCFPQHAQYVTQRMGDEPQIAMKNFKKTNISRGIKLALLDMNMPIYDVKDEIFLDNEAHIRFQKGVSDSASSYEIISMPFKRFIALPYMNNFGIVMPYEFLFETDTHIMYKANVIDRFYE